MSLNNYLKFINCIILNTISKFLNYQTRKDNPIYLNLPTIIIFWIIWKLLTSASIGIVISLNLKYFKYLKHLIVSQVS